MTQGCYTTEEVIANFTALLNDTDFSQELALLKIGKFQFMRRRQLLLEFQALYIALWRLALASSFPVDGEHIFQAFLQKYAATHTNEKTTARLLTRCQQYADILLAEGDKNYTNISLHILSFIALSEKDRKALSLHLALAIRKTYAFIFARLI